MNPFEQIIDITILCIGLILDTLVIMVLAKLITKQNVEEDWIKPLTVAILASAGSAAAMSSASAMEDYLLLFFAGVLLSLALLVTIGCWLLMGIEFSEALAVGGAFLAYKLVFIGIFVAIGMAGAAAS